jgi:L-Ala-D/L-Glu epimerase
LKPDSPLRMRLEAEIWPLAAPFRTAAHTMIDVKVLVVTLEKDGRIGRGEAAGVFYLNESVQSMAEQIERLRGAVEQGIDRKLLQSLLPPSGARNALDCAMWDLEAAITGRPAWQTAGLDKPHKLLTTLTCGAAEPERMADVARSYVGARAIKIKLAGEPLDADRVRAVHEAAPRAWLAVDANQSFTRDFLERLMPVLVEARVALIEQPFPIGQESLLDGFRAPIPVAADESAQGLQDIPGLVGRFDMVNIKLDKCGGLTEGLAMAHAARAHGLETMVGNMLGTSLAMAPAFLLGQLCHVVDLDGAVFLKTDRDPGAEYVGGFINCPESLWGASRT